MTDIEKIALHYGFKEQARQTIEEMAELTVALSKMHREYSKKNLDNIIEELADVQIMIEQIMYLTSSKSEVKQIMEQKIKRQLSRIKEEQNERY